VPSKFVVYLDTFREWYQSQVQELLAEDSKDTTEDLATWELNDLFTCTILLNNISDTQLIHMQNTRTTKKMWDNLALVHDAKGHYIAISIQHSLFQTCTNKGDDIGSTMSHSGSLKQAQEALGKIKQYG
jgi:hypothetical protein